MTKKRTDESSPTAAAAPANQSKLEQVEALLCRPDGATIADLITATRWQQHSVRVAMAGSLKKRGHSIISEKVEGVRRYRIAAQ